ncbi:MAG: hypothetical protein U9R16_09695 [Campylobacterota bacterium]|nr:hypothetical protein [Campylobacterota bacterium]
MIKRIKKLLKIKSSDEKKKEKYILMLNKFDEKIKILEKKDDQESIEKLLILKQLGKKLNKKLVKWSEDGKK